MVIGIIAGAVALVCVFVILSYNSLVKARQRVRNSESQIDVQIQKRFDLVDSMWDMVKEYAKHESSTFENTVKLRERLNGVKTPEEKMQLQGEADKCLRTLMATFESHPELKAGQNYMALQSTLRESEEKTALARQFYNDSVTIYNMKIEKFPSNIFAKLFHFVPEKLFESSVRKA